jgi:uncharacterized circularly permuted ATP-grasp superfamily protein
MRTIEGRVQVDVIYRRIDDDYPRSAGVPPGLDARRPGLIAAYMAGNVALVNAPGTGIADDKAIYSYMPEIVKYYSGGEAKLPNVETYRCREPQALKYVLDNLEQARGEAGRRIGRLWHARRPDRDQAQIEDFRAALVAEPARYIAQPTLALSTVPTLTESGVAPRHVDFRPFVLSGKQGRDDHAGRPDPRGAARKDRWSSIRARGGGTKDSLIRRSRSSSRANRNPSRGTRPHEPDHAVAHRPTRSTGSAAMSSGRSSPPG